MTISIPAAQGLVRFSPAQTPITLTTSCQSFRIGGNVVVG